MIKRRGFSLVELMVAIGIIGILVAVILPSFREISSNARVAKTVSLISTLELACERYYLDTGQYAREVAWYPTKPEKNCHDLYSNPGINGWKGPYIKKPLTEMDNYFKILNNQGVTVSLIEIVFNNNIFSCEPGCTFGTYDNERGFDLDGDGIYERTGQGNLFCLSGVGEKVAWKIDQVYDAGVHGDWKKTGRVRYGDSLKIYLTGG